MRSRILLTICAACAVIVMLCSGRGDNTLEFDNKVFDFGTLPASTESIVHEYKFTNISDQPVAILSVTTGCGCTRPEYPLEPVAPGKTGVVKITYVPKGAPETVNRDIKVRYRGAKAKSSGRVSLRFKGNLVN